MRRLPAFCPKKPSPSRKRKTVIKTEHHHRDRRVPAEEVFDQVIERQAEKPEAIAIPQRFREIARCWRW